MFEILALVFLIPIIILFIAIIEKRYFTITSVYLFAILTIFLIYVVEQICIKYNLYYDNYDCGYNFTIMGNIIRFSILGIFNIICFVILLHLSKNIKYKELFLVIVLKYIYLLYFKMSLSMIGDSCPPPEGLTIAIVGNYYSYILIPYIIILLIKCIKDLRQKRLNKK